MRFLVLMLTMLLIAPSSGRGQDATSATLLDKAIKATGGEAKLTKLQAMTIKGKGIYHQDGQKLPFTLSWWSVGADKYRQTIEIDAMGAKSQETWVMNGKEGWHKLGPLVEAKAMGKDELEETREEVYFNWISMLAPLKGKDFKLTPLDEAKIEGRAVVGFSVARKGNREAKLYFDKETGLLAKGERKVKDEGKDISEETYFGGYKDVDGVKMAMRVVVRREGKPHAELDISDAKLEEKLDAKLFTKP